MSTRRSGEVRVRGDLSRGLEAVNARHANVHEDDVGGRAPGEFDRGLTVGRLPDDLDVAGRFDEYAEAGANEGLVVGEEYANQEFRTSLAARRSSLGARAVVGSSACTLKPPVATAIRRAAGRRARGLVPPCQQVRCRHRQRTIPAASRAVVDHVDEEQPIPVRDGDVGRRVRRMTDDVGERFLNDSIRSERRLSWRSGEVARHSAVG